jgi:hypothetical protein
MTSAAAVCRLATAGSCNPVLLTDPGYQSAEASIRIQGVALRTHRKYRDL